MVMLRIIHQVAAMVPGSDGVENCILAAVCGYNPDTRIYQIIDIDGDKSLLLWLRLAKIFTNITIDNISL